MAAPEDLLTHQPLNGEKPAARRPVRRFSRALYLLLAAYIAISLGYYAAGAAAAVQKWFYPSDYARVPVDVNEEAGSVIDVVREEAAKAGIRAGDRLKSLNGVPFSGDYQLESYVRHSRPGDTLSATISQSNGIARTVSIRLAPGEPTAWNAATVGLMAAVLLLPLLSLGIGYWVVAARPHNLNAWLVLVVLSYSEVFFGNLDWKWWPGAPFVIFGFWLVTINTLAYPALLLLGVYFPERWRLDVRWSWLKWLILGPLLASFPMGVLYFYARSFGANWGPAIAYPDALFRALIAISIIFFWIAIFDKLRTASTADARRRLRVLLIGSAVSLGPMEVLFAILPFFGINPHFNIGYELVVPFFAIFPLTLAYVLVVQRAMDLRILLRMGTKYTLARGLVWLLRAALVAFLIYLFSVPTHHLVDTEARIAAIIALILMMRFRAFRHLSAWVDRQFFREAYNTELVLTELSDQVRLFTDRDALIETVTRRISDVLHVPEIAVWLRGSDTLHLLGTPAAMALSDGSATVQTVERTNHPITLYREDPDEWFLEAPIEERRALDRVNAEVLLGLPGRDRLLGIIALGPKKSEEPYASSDLRLLRTVATQTGLALEVSELAHSLAREAAQRERINREIEIAREVQERLFPQRIPQVKGLDLAGYCRPAQSVGGDYYDFIELENGRLGLAIGDISGKGISAALLMASLRASLRGMTLYGSDDLAALMQKVNRLVYEASANNRYATFFFAVYDGSLRELHYVNAGHNPPVLLRGEEVRRLETGGPVIGLLPRVHYVQGSLTLAPGDVLLAYTDGISEAMTIADEEWGEERMIAALEGAREKNAAGMVTEIFRAADAFTGAAPQHDDMTLLVMKVN
ncbi:MAG TPA: SpoIIE family protein phosphatase [Bryobacteraceae bacterium]